MQRERKPTGLRTLELVVVLGLGLGLGAAVPTLAETRDATMAVACSAAEATIPDASEWAVPPAPGRPGEPY